MSAITQDELDRLQVLRLELFVAIKESLEADGHCKSYEGTFQITATLPNYFEDKEIPPVKTRWSIELHCYVIGPHRHYEWFGDTLSEALGHAERDVRAWIKAYRSEELEDSPPCKHPSIDEAAKSDRLAGFHTHVRTHRTCTDCGQFVCEVE